MTNNPLSSFVKLIFLVYKWLVIVPMLVVSTSFVCICIILMSMMGMPDLAGRIFGTAWARINLATMLSDVTIEIAGEESADKESAGKIDNNQSYIITANHQSLIDIYVLYGYLGKDIKWVMKKELRKIPLFGFACEKMGHIIIDRSNSQASLDSLHNARSRIIRGNSAVFFPEGTRSRDGQLLPFKKGAFRLAIELGLPVLPVTIRGTRDVLPSHTMDWQPGHLKLILHEPIATKDLTEKDVNWLRDQVRNRIATSLPSEFQDDTQFNQRSIP